jgi:hypothetical protein
MRQVLSWALALTRGPRLGVGAVGGLLGRELFRPGMREDVPSTDVALIGQHN